MFERMAWRSNQSQGDSLYYDKVVEKVLHFAFALVTDATHLKALADTANYRLKLTLSLLLAQARISTDESIKQAAALNVTILALVCVVRLATS